MNINGKTTEIIINDIERHISLCPGKFYSEFFIGVTHDPGGELFKKHKVIKKTDCWTYHRSIDCKSALEVKKHMCDKGMKGVPDEGDDYCIYVYCYQITSHTIEYFESTK